MGEVEITSEFAQLMIKGVVGKTQKAIDNLYQEFDDRWDERAEVERRFRHCMGEIENAVGAEIANTAFRNRAAFHGLFCAVYDVIFEIGSPLKRKKAESLPSSFKTRVLSIGDNIQNSKGREGLGITCAANDAQGLPQNRGRLFASSTHSCLGQLPNCLTPTHRVF